MKTPYPTLSRRQFVATSTATSIGAAFGIVGCKKTTTAPVRSSGNFVGEGAHKYEVINDWVSLPDRYSWQITHNVSLDKDGFLYVIHEGDETLTDHPAIFVFDPAGQFVKAFGSQFQGGGHGLEVRTEGSEQ